MSLTTAWIQFPTRACEKVVSDLALAGAIRWVLRFLPVKKVTKDQNSIHFLSFKNLSNVRDNLLSFLGGFSWFSPAAWGNGGLGSGLSLSSTGKLR